MKKFSRFSRKGAAKRRDFEGKPERLFPLHARRNKVNFAHGYRRLLLYACCSSSQKIFAAQIFFGMPCKRAYEILIACIHSFRKPKVFGKLSALASNEVNFAKRPLAGIYAKLTKLRDNFVVAMAWFLLARVNYLK